LIVPAAPAEVPVLLAVAAAATGAAHALYAIQKGFFNPLHV